MRNYLFYKNKNNLIKNIKLDWKQRYKKTIAPDIAAALKIIWCIEKEQISDIVFF